MDNIVPEDEFTIFHVKRSMTGLDIGGTVVVLGLATVYPLIPWSSGRNPLEHATVQGALLR